MPWLYLNGNLVREDEAAVSALDRAFFHGHALIETFRSRDGCVFRLAQHYERLCRGGEVLGIPIQLTLPDLEAAVATVLARNERPDARLRLTVTAGPEGAMLRSAAADQHERNAIATPPDPLALRFSKGERRSHVTLTAVPLTDYPPQLYERGMHATVAGVRRNETSPLSRIKCAAGLLDGVLAREQARAAGFDEAIMLNTRGLVAEATVSNVFAVKAGRLLTPPVEAGAMPGVTRAAVVELAREAGVDAMEADLSLEELRTAVEAFLTNSVMGVMPLTRLDGAAIGGGKPGEMTGAVGRLLTEAARRASPL